MGRFERYHNFKCRRCAEMKHRSQVVRTPDIKWICKKCKRNEDSIKEMAKK